MPKSDAAGAVGGIADLCTVFGFKMGMFFNYIFFSF